MQYELTLLLPDEAEVKSIKDLIAELKGKITRENKWGKKILAYPIKKTTEAFYFNFGIEMDQKNLPDLNKKLNFNEKLIRYLLLKLD